MFNSLLIHLLSSLINYLLSSISFHPWWHCKVYLFIVLLFTIIFLLSSCLSVYYHLFAIIFSSPPYILLLFPSLFLRSGLIINPGGIVRSIMRLYYIHPPRTFPSLHSLLLLLLSLAIHPSTLSYFFPFLSFVSLNNCPYILNCLHFSFLILSLIHEPSTVFLLYVFILQTIYIFRFVFTFPQTQTMYSFPNIWPYILGYLFFCFSCTFPQTPISWFS